MITMPLFYLLQKHDKTQVVYTSNIHNHALFQALAWPSTALTLTLLL